VTSVLPAPPFTVPRSEDWTPLPAVAALVPLGRLISGQKCRQPLLAVQVILPPFSEVSMYRVWPFWLTRTVPSPATFFALTVTLEAEVPALLALLAPPAAAGLEEPDGDVAADEPHAATVTAAPKITPTPSSRRADEAQWGWTVMLTRETLL
jgi:hypothetical protein